MSMGAMTTVSFDTMLTTIVENFTIRDELAQKINGIIYIFLILNYRFTHE